MIYIRNPSSLDEWEALTSIKGFEMDEEVNGELVVKFATFESDHNPGYDFLKAEALIEVAGREFRVKQFQKNRNVKKVTAISEYFSLNGKRKETIFGGTHTFDEFASFVFDGSGWTFINQDVTGSAFIPNFGNDSRAVLIEGMLAAFECERQILPGNVVLFAKEIGPDNDAVYRFGHNLNDLTLKEDTSKLATRIKAYGGDGLEVEYISPNQAVFGDIEAEPFQDERFTVPESLVERAKQELTDYPEVLLEIDSVEITDKELGERVWLIHELMGIEFQTRILSKKTIIRNGKFVTDSSVVGNSLIKRVSDILKEQTIKIDENAKQTISKFEQTNERITLEVERIDESISTIELRADAIELSVTSIDGRLGTAESNILIQAGQISSKVSQTDYNGNTIASLINQTSTTIDIQADKINLVGAVTVLSDISGNLGTITAGSILLSTDVEVGRYLRVGRGFDTMSKGITFKGTAASIDVNGDNMIINAQAITLNGIVSASNLNATTLQGYYPWDFASSGHSHFYPMQIRPGYEHQIGTTFYLTSNRLVLRTPSGTELQFAAV